MLGSLNCTHDWRFDSTGLSGVSWSSEANAAIPMDGKTGLMKGRRSHDMTTVQQRPPVLCPLPSHGALPPLSGLL